MMKYKISRAEIFRRKRAYITFSSSLIIGLFLGSVIFCFPLSLYVYSATIIVLFLIGVFSSKFFINLLQTTIRLDRDNLIKATKLFTEKYPLSNMDRVEIKWTSQKTIREIYVWLKKSGSVFITALNNFIGFKDELLAKLDKKICIKESHEPIAYDHPLFYVVLGLLIGSLSVCGFKNLIKADHQQIKIGVSLLFIYSAGLGVYFFVAKPISKRSGEKTKLFDYIAGTTIILMGILIYSLIFGFI